VYKDFPVTASASPSPLPLSRLGPGLQSAARRP